MNISKRTNIKKDPQKIVEQIIKLVSELASLAGVSAIKTSTQANRVPVIEKKATSGATGGLRFLIEGGKLNTPKQLPEIIELLRQDGRHYSRQTVSMGLLNLVRERILTRFRDKGDKNWKYVIRK